MSQYSIPCPSPNGTNYERLYLVRKPMAMDQAFDPNDNPGEQDTEEKVRELLSSKLSQEDLDQLCNLIFRADTGTAPGTVAQDRRRQAHDRRPVMPSRAMMEKLVAEGAARRADRVLKQNADLMVRFPALRGSRVV
jgi:hypothetical protein